MMMKLMMKMMRPDCKFWSVFLSFRNSSCVFFVEKKKRTAVSEMKIFCQVLLEQICRGGCGGAIGEYWGLQQSEIPHYFFYQIPQFSVTLLKVLRFQHISINNQPWMMILTALKLFPQSQKESFKIWFKPCDDGTQRRIGKWLQFSENVINQLWRRPLATISCSERGRTRWRSFFLNKNWEVRDIDGVLTSPITTSEWKGPCLKNFSTSW